MNDWYGFEKGTNQYSMSKVFTSSNEYIPSNQKELAESYGITQQTMNNYMRMASMIPELEDLVDTGILGDDAEEIDAMDWMHTHQLSSKNLTAGEKLAMTEEFKKEVALENEKRKSEAISESNKNRNSNTLQLECNENESKSRSNTWTDSQTAKKAGVGVGTVARYDAIMKTDDL